MDNEKLNILQMLIESKEEYSIRQIAKKRGINYKSAYKAVEKLEKEGIINVNKQGNISLCSFNSNYSESVYLVESERKNALLKDKNFQVIHNRIGKINSQFILLLFGSYANNKATKSSDIDFLVISDLSEGIEKEMNLLPLKIHLTSITYNDFISMLKSKEQNVVSEALKNNILLFGIEDYYRLIKNAR